MVTSTRWGYRHRIGPIADGLGVLHTCDVPHCHNDAHWFLGTNAENVADKVAKGRMPRHSMNRGQGHGMAKLTADQVQSIRDRYAAGGVKQSDLAVEFGILQQQVSRIVRRTSWRD